MDAGERGSKRQRWATGDTGLPIAMSSITTSAIDTPARRSVGADLRRSRHHCAGARSPLIASLTFRDYGLGWDDYTHAEYADLLLRMYGSGFRDTARAVVRQSLHVWRRLRHGGRPAAQGHPARTVRNAPPARRRRRRDRACGDVAARRGASAARSRASRRCCCWRCARPSTATCS